MKTNYKITIEKLEIIEYRVEDYNWIDKEGKDCEYDTAEAKKKYYETGELRTRTDETKLLEQTVEVLDIDLVIRAVNKLS